MRYQDRHILNSERAYSILRFIYHQEEGSYATEIAEDLDVDRSLVSEILGKLEEMGVLKEGKRTQAQYYEVDIDGLYAILLDVWVQRLEEDAENYLDDIKKDMRKDYKESGNLEEFEKMHDFEIGFGAGEEFHNYIRNYLKNYLDTETQDDLIGKTIEWNTVSTINDMIMDDFFVAVWSENIQRNNIKKRVENAKDDLSLEERREIGPIKGFELFIKNVFEYGLTNKNPLTPGIRAFYETRSGGYSDYARKVNEIADEEIYINIEDEPEED